MKTISSISFIFPLLVFVKKFYNSEAELILEFNEHKYFKGSKHLLNIQDPCHNIGQLNNQVSGVKLLSGSCALLYDQQDCTGDEFVISYLRNSKVSFLDNTYDYFNDKTSSVSSCHTRPFHVQCPEGTFVKAINDETQNRRGITLECFSPGGKTFPKRLSTHGYTKIGENSQECPVTLRGILFTKDPNLNAIVRMNASCTYESNHSEFVKEHCGKNQAVCGLNGTTEANTELIKVATVLCCDIPDPAKSCRPSDDYNVLHVCDNLNAISPTKCIYQKTVGVSIPKSIMSEEEAFYCEFAFRIGTSGSVLEMNFKSNVGQSKKTGLIWADESIKTWKEETTTTVEMEIPGGIRATLFQVVGTCSFYKVYTSTVKREDYWIVKTASGSPYINDTTISIDDSVSWFEMNKMAIIGGIVIIATLVLVCVIFRSRILFCRGKRNQRQEGSDDRYENASFHAWTGNGDPTVKLSVMNQ